MIEAHNVHDKVVEILLTNSAEIDMKTFKGTTALMIASQNGHDKVVELLLIHKARVN